MGSSELVIRCKLSEVKRGLASSSELELELLVGLSCLSDTHLLVNNYKSSYTSLVFLKLLSLSFK